MNIDERIRSGEESLIKSLKCKYTPGVKFYQWFTLFSSRHCDDCTIESCY